MSETIQIFFRTLVACSCPLALLFVMSGFKCARKTAWAVFGLIALAGTAVCFTLILTAGLEQMWRVYFLVLLVPSLLFLLFATTDRPSQVLFNFFTAVNAFYLTSILSHFVFGSDGEPIWGDALFRLVVFGLILFVFVRWLREAYRFIAANMKRDWRVMAVLPFLFFALVMFLGLYPHKRTDNLMGVAFLYVILCVVYYVIYRVFHNTYELLKATGENDALKSQVAALQRQADAVSRNEEKIRVYRHDMRFITQATVSMLERGDVAGALKYLGESDAKLNDTSLVHYCDNAVLDALIAYYAEKAQEQGICVTARMDLGESLPADEMELSTVFANALENAIHACCKLPEGAERRIELTAVSSPHFCIEVANTYTGEVSFDEEGFPVTQEPGHGLGARSIAAFMKKYDAVYSYKLSDGVFHFQFLINWPVPPVD